MASGSGGEFSDYQQGNNHASYRIFAVGQSRTTFRDIPTKLVWRVDDVEDNSLLRRGIPVAHNIFGTAQTVNSANYVYFVALQELFKLNNPKTIQIYTDELCNLHRGQGMDLFWRDTLTCPTEQDYLQMVANKTGGLFRLAVQLMQAESASEM